MALNPTFTKKDTTTNEIIQRGLILINKYRKDCHRRSSDIFAADTIVSSSTELLGSLCSPRVLLYSTPFLHSDRWPAHDERESMIEYRIPSGPMGKPQWFS